MNNNLGTLLVKFGLTVFLGLAACAMPIATYARPSQTISNANVSASNTGCRQGHWRDVAYDTKIMSRYKPYAHCVQWTAMQFELPEELLYSIIYVERGDINGRCMTNNNGTEDCGPAQINDVRLGEIRQFDLGKGDMRTNPCRNIWAMGYLIRREVEKADLDLWRGVGNYHYHYSVNQAIHNRYVTLVRNAWIKLQENVVDQCMKDGR